MDHIQPPIIFPKKHSMVILGLLSLVFCLWSTTGCQSAQGYDGLIGPIANRSLEASGIRDGEPIEYENGLWYPADGTENFLDTEMLFVAEYRGVAVFVDKVDVRPYDRLYTKFDRNKFRFFEKRTGE
jgi:hypothetical protein